jgi:poly(ADP-ribose) glycohydrolase ARH3
MKPATTGPSVAERFEGCLLGLAVGDALGGRFEGMSAGGVRGHCPTVADLMDHPQDELWYTDDTQMAIGVAETLAAHGEIVEEHLCAAFVANYEPFRGYGWGTRLLLETMQEGRDHRAVARQHLPGGSYGNGAAMRVAPVGLVFGDHPERLCEQARRSAMTTHTHPLGVDGARVLALAVGQACRATAFDRDAFFDRLLRACESEEFRARLGAAARATTADDLAALGNGIAALDSVPTAIASFALAPYSYEEAIGRVILLGGDTDTMAAMAGALAGAHLGVRALPSRLVDLLEDGPKGRTYIRQLAARLAQAGGQPAAGP